MRFGALRNGAMFVTAFAAMLAALSVGAPPARSQVGLLQRMTFMHSNPQLHYSILDPSLPPTPSAGEVVGKFLGATSQGSRLVEGHAYPHHINPDYLYGVTADGFTIKRVGQTGSQIDSTSFGNIFARVTGAWLVTNQVAVSPQWIPRAYDLKEHFIVVGEIDQTNPSMTGNSTGMMLINPKTMAGYPIANAALFLGPTSDNMFEDVCFGVYAGADGDYATIDDNQYRYITFMSVDQQETHQLYCLSLNRHETMNGTDPPSPWNPVPQERGPAYTNVFPIISSNPGASGQLIGPPAQFPAVENEQMYCRAYYARPALAAMGFDAPTDAHYVVAGWVVELPTNPISWAAVVQPFSISTSAPIVATDAYLATSGAYPTDDIFKGMSIVGDWLITSVGDGISGDGYADAFVSWYLPELLDNGDNDGDGGLRSVWAPTAGSVGWAGYHVGISGHPVITYAGPGGGSSVAYGTTRNPFTDHGAGIFNTAMTGIDMHTEEEKLLGINIRRAPQPFVGFWFSEDPATNFPGFRDGGGSKNGGCSGSAEGGMGQTAGLLGFVGMAFLMVQVLKEARRA